MENEYFKFNPGTNTVRTPIPTTFEHLLGWVDKIEQYLTIHNQEDIVNINKLLETTLNLQISNIIQRVIAQVIGEYKEGFVTIKGTEDGALHVYLADTAATLEILATLQAGTNLIGKVQIEGTSQTVKSAKISSAAGGDILTITPTGSNKIKVTTVVLTVAGATEIKFIDGTTDLTGAMDFGGTNEPRGMVANHGNHPLETTAGAVFKVNSSQAIQVSGYVIYYEEA